MPGLPKIPPARRGAHRGCRTAKRTPRLIRSRKLARYRCPECKYGWSDHTRDIAVRNGRWRPYIWTGKHFEPAPVIDDAASVGYHMPAILSRFVSLSRPRRARHAGKNFPDDPNVKQQYYNDDLGRPYTPVVMETDKEQLLKLRDMSLAPAHPAAWHGGAYVRHRRAKARLLVSGPRMDAHACELRCRLRLY